MVTVPVSTQEHTQLRLNCEKSLTGSPEIVRPGDTVPSLSESSVHTLPIECCFHVLCHLAYVCMGGILLHTGRGAVPLTGTILLYAEEGQFHCPCPALPYIIEPVLHYTGGGVGCWSLSQPQPCSYLVYSTLTVREGPACHCPARIWGRIWGWGCRTAESSCEASSATCSAQREASI